MNTGNVASFSCGAIADIEVLYFGYTELDAVPKGAGWYCWIYVPKSVTTIRPAISRPTHVDAEITSNFKQSFTGRLGACDAEPPFTDHLRDLQTTTVAFAPPLYIGISVNLARRLGTHKKQLDAALAYDALQLELGNQPAPDTVDESRYFGARMAKALNDADAKTNCLYVKCVLSTSEKALRSVESVLNHSYTPAYGRR